MSVVRLAALLAMLLSATPLRAEDDRQLWTAAVASGPVRGELALFAYAETRFGDEASGLTQTLLGAGLGWEPSDRFSLYGGYLLITTYRPGSAAIDERRFWQQAGYALGAIGRVRLSGRTMIEERSFEGARDLGWRLQQQVRAALPVAARGRVRIVGYGEILVNFNNADWGARAGVDQLRGFAGLNLPVGRAQAVETGYFHQRILRAGAPDRINHVALLVLSHRFGR